MAPRELIGRYKLYKSKTKGLVYWLTKTAGECSDLKTIIKSLGLATNSKKGDTAELEIHTAELVKLAETISTTKTAVEVPEGVILLIEDVIKGREESAEWYSAQALDGKVQRENQTHRYFILVLRRILELLKTARAKLSCTSAQQAPSRPSKGKKSGKGAAYDGSLGSLFACLEIEEPSEDALGSEPPPQMASTFTGRKKVTYKLETEEEDSAFEVWYFLQDLYDVRSFVEQAWEEYSRGTTSFLAASSITDTAFGLLRFADEDFAAKSALKSSAWHDIMGYLGLEMFSRKLAFWMCPISEGAALRGSPSSDINIVELLCPVAAFCLEAYQEDAKLICNFYGSDEGKAQGGHPTVPCRPMHVHPLCCVLGDLAPGLYHVGHCCSHEGKLVDEFVQGLLDVHRQRKPPMWMTVAYQIYLDIYDLLGDHLGHGVEALQNTFQSTRETFTDIYMHSLGVDDSMADVKWAIGKLGWLANAALRFDSTVNKPIEGTPEQASSLENEVKAEVGCAASVIEKSLPAYAGAILLDLKVGAHEAGCIIANHHCVVVSMGHLYKALRAMGVLQTDWHDMDFVLSAFGTKQPLLANASGEYDGEAAARHYLIALGCSPREFAADHRRRNKLTINWKNIPRISVTSKLLKALCQRQNSWERYGLGHPKSRMVEAVLHALAEDDDSKTKKTYGSHLKTAYTPGQLLTSFKKKLLHDEPTLHFDFTSFTLVCARLLVQLTEKLGDVLNLDDKDLTRGFHFALVDRLLRSTPDAEAIAEASAVINSHIESAGKQYIKKACDQSSGRIPKDLRPKIQLDEQRKRDRRNLICAMLDHSGTKYSFCGALIAAYHPGIKPEPCCKDGRCGERYAGSETYPRQHTMDEEDQYRFGFMSALPHAIVDNAVESIRKDPATFVASKLRLMEYEFKDHALGLSTEETLRKQAQLLMDMDLIRADGCTDSDAAAGLQGWKYVMKPEHAVYDAVFQRLKTLDLSEETPVCLCGAAEGSDILISVAMLGGPLRSLLEEEAATGRSRRWDPALHELQRRCRSRREDFGRR